MNEFALTVNFVPTAGGAHRAKIPNGIDLTGNWEAMIINSKVVGGAILPSPLYWLKLVDKNIWINKRVNSIKEMMAVINSQLATDEMIVYDNGEFAAEYKDENGNVLTAIELSVGTEKLVKDLEYMAPVILLPDILDSRNIVGDLGYSPVILADVFTPVRVTHLPRDISLILLTSNGLPMQALFINMTILFRQSPLSF
jgi:hypothetical protein